MSKTNRTQIIDKMGNKQLALYLAYGAHIVDGDIDTANFIDIDDRTRAEIAKNSIEIEKWLSEKAKSGTADEMFKELGYERTHNDKNGDNWYVKVKKYKKVIINVLCNPSNVNYSKYSLIGNESKGKYDGGIAWEVITEAEDKAIHKRISELKAMFSKQGEIIKNYDRDNIQGL